jgi:DNA-binding response OmpR family regulator
MKPNGTKYRILLVEDDVALAEIYQLRLQAEGFEVQLCGDGEQALSHAIEFNPDLVLLDIMMPKISGFDVLDILRQTPETANCKVIVLTALTRPEDQEKAKALGADEFLVKSQIVISDIIDRIRWHLGIQPETAETPVA